MGAVVRAGLDDAPDACRRGARDSLGEPSRVPEIKDPLETALAEADRFAQVAADRRVEPGAGHLAAGSRPAGEPLIASDVYGSRRLVVAPFSYDGGGADHWYAWDIDLCWIDVVVGAGAFPTADEALGEWRDTVGPAASGAALSSCSGGMTAWLLAPCLQIGPMADMLQGDEPRDLIREYYRLRRRALDLTGSADATAGSSPFNAELQRSYATRMPSRPPRTRRCHSAARSEPSEAEGASACVSICTGSGQGPRQPTRGPSSPRRRRFTDQRLVKRLVASFCFITCATQLPLTAR